MKSENFRIGNGYSDAHVDEPIRKLPEESWRKASHDHSQQVMKILAPGLTPADHPLNTGFQRQQRKRKDERRKQPSTGDQSESDATAHETVTALDPKHPVYNFLIEYYGLKGTKGVRRLLKWSPGIHETAITGIQDQEFRGEIFLEGATEQDFFTSLQAKGTRLFQESGEFRGVVYSPSIFVNGNKTHNIRQRTKEHSGISTATSSSSFLPPGHNNGPLAPFQWYRSLLERTPRATPVLHCYGLHEWAMQYQPTITNNQEVKDPKVSLPPSSKYQSHLQLRIDQETLNKTVETNTLYCSHVDAWKYFAKEALPLNQFIERKINNENHKYRLPAAGDRSEWILRSEQPACVHTTMDILKIALKLGPFCDSGLFRRVLALTIEARALDVAASPYDAKSSYGVEPIEIENPAGRSEYKLRQIDIMKRAEPIRKDLLSNYDTFLSAFS